VSLEAGQQARRAGMDLGSSRLERALLGVFIARPAMLHALAEELGRLQIANPELARLQTGLLDTAGLLAEGLDPAADAALDQEGPEQEGPEQECPQQEEPAADEIEPHGPKRGQKGGRESLESRLLADHLQRNGLGRLAELAEVKARELFRDRPDQPDAWIEQWRRTAEHLRRRVSGEEELRQLQEALARDPSEENFQRMQAAIGRLQREGLETGSN
jgi:DNA primase